MASSLPNTYFWRFANTDRLLMDINGNLAIGQTSTNTAYKFDVNGAIRGSSFVQGSTTYDLSLIPRLSLTTLGTVEASKALVADASYGITDLRSLTISGSTFSKSLVIQNDNSGSAASMNLVSLYQCEIGVNGNGVAGAQNRFFIKYALSDRLIMDTSGNINIGGSTINTSYKLDVSGALNCSSLTIGGVAIAPQTNILEITPGTTFSSTTRASDFNLLIRNKSNTTGAQAGISYVIEGAAGLP